MVNHLGDNRFEKKLPSRISSISVERFKSIESECKIEVRPLTILAGVNSSGKSSIIQPLLLMKQTLEAPYDPGALLLNGPNAKFSRVEQMLSSSSRSKSSDHFSVGIGVNTQSPVKFYFQRGDRTPIDLQMSIDFQGEPFRFGAGEYQFDDPKVQLYISRWVKRQPFIKELFATFHIDRVRCFLMSRFETTSSDADGATFGGDLFECSSVEQALLNFIHLPGLRGNPQRSYPLTAVGGSFPGTFDPYVASLIRHFGEFKDESKLSRIGEDLRELGLTWKVVASAVDDTQVELKVGRMPKPLRGGAQDLVGIADVGFGLSQTLPVVVALVTAVPEQLVYIEQPEIHLHPRAQHAMAKLLARAAQRGVQVIIETHSSILLLGIQNLVARGELDPALVKLHWFQRDEEGKTKITSAELDEAGRFGDWPEDFDDVTLNAQQQFLDAAEKHLFTS